MLIMIGLLCMSGMAMAVMIPTESATKEDDMTTDDEIEADVDSAMNPASSSQVGNSLLEIVAAALEEAPTPTDEDALVYGSEENETLVGGDGDDFIDAGAGDDELLGGAGADVLLGGAGQDIAVSDEGEDSLYGGTGDDALHARAGNDLLIGGNGEDSLFGGEGDDTLYGGDDAEDYLIGAEGDDVLIFGQGDHAYGGEGKDTFILFDTATSVEAAELADFDPNEDVVVIMVEPEDADAEVSLAESEDNPDQMELRVNGEIFGSLSKDDTPDLADIKLLVFSIEM